MGLGASAQTINKTELKSQKAGPASEATVELSTESSMVYRASSAPEAAGDIIFNESFGNGLMGDGTNGAWTSSATYGASGTSFAGWEYRSPSSTPDVTVGSRGNWVGTRGPIVSPTAANGFFIFDSDYYDNGGRDANDNPGPAGGGPFPTPHEGDLVSPVIDLSAYTQDVTLKMNISWRRFQSDGYVMFTTDGGATWTDTLEIFHDANNPVNSASAEDATFVTFFPANVLGSSTAQMRIWFDGQDAHGSTFSSGYYYWMVDDIILMETPNNDLAIGQKYFNGYQDSTAIKHYRQMPELQANNDSIFFGTVISNRGVADQTNAKLEVSFEKDGAAFGTPVVSNAVTVIVSGADSVEMDNANMFAANGGIGEYVMNFNVVSDSTDANPTDNMDAAYLDVTQNIYAWDNDNMSSGNWYNATSDWEMLVYYKMNVADTARAISVLFPDLSNGYGLQPGDAISYYLYDESDLAVPIAKHEFYIVQDGDQDVWLTLPLPSTALGTGGYYAGFKVYSDQIGVASNSGYNEETPPLKVLVRVDAADPTDLWSYSTTLLPYVRLITSNPDACNNVSIAIADTVYDNQAIGAINIGVTGGTPQYTYSWTGPNSYISSVKNPNDIPHQGVYTVVVTDVIGCVGTKDVTVGGIVTVEELSLENNVNLFPNPNNGEFTLAMNGLEGVYTISIKNVIGQTLSIETVNVSGNMNKTISNRDLNKGIYFVEVSDNAGAKTVIRFIVE